MITPEIFTHYHYTKLGKLFHIRGTQCGVASPHTFFANSIELLNAINSSSYFTDCTVSLISFLSQRQLGNLTFRNFKIVIHASAKQHRATIACLRKKIKICQGSMYSLVPAGIYLRCDFQSLEIMSAVNITYI